MKAIATAGLRMRRSLLIAALLLAITLAAVMPAINRRLTSYVESDRFRAEMEKETAKGLHFPNAHYAPIKRTGMWTTETSAFQAKDGWKALSSIDARGIRARFNPLGLFLRRWQLDEVHIQGGEARIQVYEPKPEPSPVKPWYAIFLPERVYLKRVESEPVDVTWRFREKRAGFFGTRLLITPHGRDFDYQAREGELKMPMLPEMNLMHTHLTITKTLLTLYNLDLQSKASSTGTVHAEGKAGTRDDKSIDFRIRFDRMPVNEWLPNEWHRHADGEIIAKVHWLGENPKLETSHGDAALRIENGQLNELPTLQKLAALTGEKEIARLRLNLCQMNLEWRYPNAEIKDLVIEDKRKFRADGRVTIQERKLEGAINLGVAPHLLSWLPKAAEVFPDEHDGYMWTKVRLSGTLDAPEQDLSPRIVDALKESPGAALGILFRGLGEWLRNAFSDK